MADPYRPLFFFNCSIDTEFTRFHAIVNQFASIQRRSNCLGPLCLEAYTAASPTAALCQASVAERQLSSRLNGGEAVMSHST